MRCTKDPASDKDMVLKTTYYFHQNVSRRKGKEFDGNNSAQCVAQRPGGPLSAATPRSNLSITARQVMLCSGVTASPGMAAADVMHMYDVHAVR